MTLRRDLLLRSALLASAALCAAPAQADTAWNPDRTLRIIVPVAPGERILTKPEVAEQLTAQGFEVTSQGPAQFAHLIQAEARRWPALVRRTGAQPD
jgi:tripartite-type tricarboxylate transporter receptor subunit TctC